MDHLSKWIRFVRLDIATKRVDARKARRTVNSYDDQESRLIHIDSILSSINEDLMANAAFSCKAYARALMMFEMQIVSVREREPGAKLQSHYERLHEIYANLDEPDGMEGLSSLINFPSLEHQIREHESTGRWTSAQSCWEVKIQRAPDDVSLHVGLLRCLRNLGHYGETGSACSL